MTRDTAIVPHSRDDHTPLSELPDDFDALIEGIKIEPKEVIFGPGTVFGDGFRLNAPLPISPAEAIGGLLNAVGVAATGDLGLARQKPEGCDWYIPSGRIWDRENKRWKPGMYFVPSLIAASRIPDVFQAAKKSIIESRRKRGLSGAGLLESDVYDSIKEQMTGVGTDQIGAHFCSYYEIDDKPLTEQIEEYRALVEAIDIPASLIVFTGGKSLHVYYLFDRIVPVEVPVWEDIQRLLIAIMASDRNLTNHDRRMRLPGYMGIDRQQPILHYDTTATCDPDVLLNRLRDLFHARELSAPGLIGSRHFGFEDDGFLYREEKSNRKGRKGGKSEGKTHRQYIDPQSVSWRQPGSPWNGRTVADVLQSEPEGEYQCGCPVHGQNSTTNATLRILGGGRGNLTCWSDACKVDGLYALYLFSPPKKVMQDDPNGIRVVETSEILTERGHIAVGKLIRLFKKTPERTVIVIQAPTGTGKTHFAEEVSKETKRKGGRVIAVSPTRSLTAGMGGRLQVESYLKIDGAIEQSAAVCFPSIPRVRLVDVDLMTMEVKEHAVGSLIVDESEACARSLVGRHLSDRQSYEACTGFRDALGMSQYVFLLDAGVGEGTAEMIKMAGLERKTLWIRVPEQPRYTWLAHPSRGSLRSQILSWAMDGDRVGVACASAAEARALGQVIADETRKRVGIVAGKLGAPAQVTIINGDKDQQHDLADLSWVDSVDVLLWTWAMGTGVDLPGEWDHVAYIAHIKVPHTVPQVRQMVGRIRNLKDTEVHVYAERSPYPQPWTRDPQKILARWQKADKAERKKLGLPTSLLDITEIKRTPRGAFESVDINLDRRDHIQLQARIYAANVADGQGWLDKALREDAARREEKMTMLPDAPASEEEKALNKLISIVRKAIKRGDAEALATAPRLTEAQIKTIRRRGAKDVDEALSAAMHRLEDFHGPAFADASTKTRTEMALADAHGKRRGAVCRGIQAIYAEPPSELPTELTHGAIFAELDRLEVESERTPSPQRSTRRVTRGLIDQAFLVKLGIPLEWIREALRSGQIGSDFKRESKIVPDLATSYNLDLVGKPGGPRGVILTSKAITEVCDRMWSTRLNLSHFGITVSKDAGDPDKHRRWVHRYLKSLGLTVKTVRKQQDGERVRHTQVSWDALCRDGAHWCAGLIAPLQTDDGVNHDVEVNPRPAKTGRTALVRVKEQIARNKRIQEQRQAQAALESWLVLSGQQDASQPSEPSPETEQASGGPIPQR